jgi:predicted transposase YbfD/YdcC
MNDTAEKLLSVEITTPKCSFEIESLQKHLGQIRDPRKARGIRYSLPVMLSLLVLAKLCGEDELSGMADWLRLREHQLTEWLNLPRRTLPHLTTYQRLLAQLDLLEVEQVVSQFFQKQPAAGVVSLDGKTLRGTLSTGQTQGTHLLAAYAVEQGVVLHQMAVESKTNEITAAPQVIQSLDLNGCIVTGDALLTQRDICAAIQTAKGDYAFPVKANHPTVQKAIAEVFLPSLTPHHHARFTEAQTYTNQAGRVEWRILIATAVLNDYLLHLGWSHVRQVFRLQRIVHRKTTGRLSYEVVFGITSLASQQASPDRLLEIMRHHWHIENRLHYVRDVTFQEDACRLRNPHLQHGLAILNNLALGLIRQFNRFPYVPQTRRYLDAHLFEAVQLIC